MRWAYRKHLTRITARTREEFSRQGTPTRREKSDAFYEDHVGVGSGLAEGFGSGVFGRVPPVAGDFRGREFNDDDAALRPVPFEDFHFATADEETAAVLLDRGENGFAVVLITDGVVNFDADKDVSGHFGSSSEE